MTHFEEEGKPSVALISTGFKKQAEYQARTLGCEDTPRVFVKHPISDQTQEQLYEKADAVYDAVVQILKNNEKKEENKEENGEEKGKEEGEEEEGECAT